MLITAVLVSICVVILIGIPIAVALGLVAIGLMVLTVGPDMLVVFIQRTYAGTTSFPLLAIPFFVLAGNLMNVGGTTERIFEVAQLCVGRIRGGLAHVNVIGSVIFAGMSGSAVADAAGMGVIEHRAMTKAGYTGRFAATITAVSSTIGPIIPPSIPFVIYGSLANVSVGALFLAGIVPGLLIALALCVTWLLVSRKEQFALPPRQSGAIRMKAFVDAIWALMLPVIIVFGLKFGVFTPTEAGVVAAVYSLFVAMVIYRELPPSRLFHVFVAAAKITSIVMFLVACAAVSAWLITVADVPGDLVALLEPLMDNQTLLLIAIMVLIVLVGTAMDMTPTILIMTPVLMPVIKQAGIDPVYFGVLFIINNSIGLITPPVGTVLNVICGVSKLSMEDLMKGVMPFLIAELIVLFLLVLFPQLVMAPVAWFGH